MMFLAKGTGVPLFLSHSAANTRVFSWPLACMALKSLFTHSSVAAGVTISLMSLLCPTWGVAWFCSCASSASVLTALCRFARPSVSLWRNSRCNGPHVTSSSTSSCFNSGLAFRFSLRFRRVTGCGSGFRSSSVVRLSASPWGLVPACQHRQCFACIAVEVLRVVICPCCVL